MGAPLGDGFAVEASFEALEQDANATPRRATDKKRYTGFMT